MSTWTFAQNKIWDKTFGGNQSDELSIVQQTNDGGYILGGSSSSSKSGDKTAANKGKEDYATDYWVVKLKADGTKEWDKTIGGDNYDYLTSLQQTQDGGYILGGSSRSGKGGDKTDPNKGGVNEYGIPFSDYWIVKLKVDGTKVWDKTIGGDNEDNLTSLQLTSDGAYILGGSSSSGISGDKTQGSKGASDYWIIKLTSTGVIQWDKTFGGNNSDWLSSLQQTRDGGYILGGSSSSDIGGDKTESNKGGTFEEGGSPSDYWVIKLKADGTKEWDKTFGGSWVDHLSMVQQALNGNYILGGYSGSGISGDKTQGSKGDSDYWIVMLKANGTKLWDKTFGGKSEEQLTVVRQTKDGGYILGGTSKSGINGDKTTASKGGSDYWIVKLKADGTKVWDKTFGGKEEDYLCAIQQTSDDGFIMGGSSASGKSSNKSQTSKGDSDYWILKLDNSGTNLNQDISFVPILYKNLGDVPFPLLATATSGLPVHFSVVSGPAIIKGSILTLTGLGTVTIKASVAGNTSYLPAETTRTFLVEPASMVKKQWDKTFGGSESEIETLSVVQQTSDGGYILGGSSDSEKNGDKTEASKGGYGDYWIVKLKADGSKEWDKTIGGNSFDYLTSLQQTQDGGYILGGSSHSDISGDKSQVSRGGGDYWIVKLNANGTKEWDKTIGGDNYDYLTSLQQTQDGGYILGGSSMSIISGDKSQKNNGSYDYWVVKLKADGSKAWDKTIGGDNDDKLVSLQQTSDGSYILGGNSYSGSEASSGVWIVKLKADGAIEWDKVVIGDVFSSIQQTQDDGYILGSGYNNGNFLIVKLKADGSKEWGKTFKGMANGDGLLPVQQTSDGEYILGGTTWRGKNDDKTQVSRGSSDYWVVKLKADGSKAWDKTIGGTSDDVLTCLQQTSDGGYILGGNSYSPYSGIDYSGIGGDKSEAGRGKNDYWVVKLSAEQSLTAQWNMRYGGMGKDNFTTVIQTKDGGYLSGGYTTSNVSGDKSQSSQGKNDYWIVKSDKNGKKLWEKSYGGSSDDYLNSMVQTSDGGYLLAGSSLSGIGGDKTQAGQGERDYWILKIDKQGTKLWDKTYGGSGTEELKKVILLPSGSFILAGTSNSPVSGQVSQESKGGSDYWILKINSTGKKMFDKRYGGSQEEVLEDLALTLDGGFLLGGTSTSGISGDKSEASRGGKDFWLVRISGTGEKVWDKTYGGSSDEELRALGSTNTSSGNFFVAGTSSSGKSGDKSQASQGSKDYWMLKINDTGKKLFDKSFGGSQDEELRTIQLTEEGGYLLGGSSHSGVSGDKNQSSQGSKDYWLVKTTDKGEKEWDQRLGGSGTEELRTVLQTKDGGYVLGGRSDSGVSGDRTQPSQGSTDYWLVKVAPVTGSNVATREETATEEPVKETASSLLKAYPNPFKEQVKISFTLPQTQPAEVKVYDNQGKEISILFKGQAQAQQTYQVEWQASNKSAGMYLLQLQTPTQRQQQKVFLFR
ncbi:T9SS type A sorting domain-containing protein [Adhaeribacter arboris]|nr:T9SS type A sorting domain-containing protein [Adhaeribacter arboris]